MYFFQKATRTHLHQIVQNFQPLSVERNPFKVKNQTLKSYRVYFSPTRWA